jgi:beta-lactamase regulating signal transducer with metallopeptidase domain
MIATFEFINHASGAALAAILNTAWEALAVAAIVWTALRLTPRVNAATRHAAWWTVLAIVVLVPFAAQSVRSGTPAMNPAQRSVQTDVPAIRAAVPVATSQLASPPLAVMDSRASGAAAEPRFVLPFEFRAGVWPERILAVWLAVFLLLLARVAASYLHLRGVRKRSSPVTDEVGRKFDHCLRQARVNANPRLLMSGEIFSPLATGFLHPVVILPEQLLTEISGTELDDVLLDELAHFARGDNWTNLLARLGAPVLMLHPVAAWALSRIEREREIACDDWVVAISGSARQYAATLARLFEVCGARRRELLATGMAHRSSRLGERIEMLLRPKRDFAPGTSLARLGLCAAGSLVILVVGAQMPGWIALAQESPVAPAVALPAAHALAPAQSQASQPLRPLQPTQAVQAATSPQIPKSPTSAAAPIQPVASSVSGDLQRLGGLTGQGWTQEWSLERSHSFFSDKVRFGFGFRQGGSESTTSTDVPVASLRDFSLSMLDHTGPVKFEYVRAAGELICEGNVAGGRASGTFTVSPNPQFISALAKMGYATPDENDVVSLMMSDVTLEFARAVKETGLNLSAGELGELRSHDVTADYIRQARQSGLTNLTAEEFCELRTHGVEPDYLRRILAADPKLSAEDIAELRTHGVEPEYLRGIEATGIALSIEDISSLRTHGVEAGYMKGIHAANGKLSIDEIDELRTHGVEPKYLMGIEAVDSNLSVEEISELRTHGVEPEYLKGIHAADRNLSIEEICELRTHGVEPSYFQGVRAIDSRLSIEEVTDLRTHGVEAEYLRDMKTADSSLHVEGMTELRTHGVPASFVSQAMRMGYHFTPEELSDLWTHGVNEAYLRNLQDMGMKNLTSEQILRLRGRS